MGKFDRLRKLRNDLFRLPELLPEKEIHKFENIWVDKYAHRISPEAILKSEISVKDFLFTDVKKRKRRKNVKR